MALPGAQTIVILVKGHGGEERVGGFSDMVFWADDIQVTYETMTANGVEFVEPTTAQPWGLMQAIFKDQDGTSMVMVGSN